MKRALLLIAVGLLWGCNKEPASPAAPAAPTPPGKTVNPIAASTSAENAMPHVTSPELDAAGKAKKAYRLVLVVKTRNNPFFTPMIDSFTKSAKDAGCQIEVEAPPQETDKEQQFAMVQTITAKGADAILIAPADSKAIVPALKAAQDKGIVVINLDNRVDPATAQAAGLNLGGYVGADNERGGQLAGQGMLEALHGSGKVAVIEGLRGVDNAEARKRGFETAAKAGLKIVAEEEGSWDTQKAYQKAQSILAAHKDLDGIFCANDKMAIGAIQAIKEAAKTGGVAVIGYDNIPDVQEYLKSGALYGTVEQHPDLMGKYGVDMAVGILNGTVPKGREYLVPLEFVKGK